MNDIITVYIKGEPKGLDYDPMYKFNSVNDLIDRYELGDNPPFKNDIVVEGWRGDNLICVNETFESFIDKIRLITGI